MQFHIAQEAPVTITLEGTLEYDYLPLADSALRFGQTCLIYCETGPIAPALYRVTISGSGYETMWETYRLSVWEQKEFHIIPEKKILSEKIANLSSLDITLPEIIEERITKLGILDTLTPIGMDFSGKTYVTRMIDGHREVSVITDDTMYSVFPLWEGEEWVYLDRSRQFFIVPMTERGQYIISWDGLRTEIFPYTDRILSVIYSWEWLKIRTNTNIYIKNEDRWIVNPRFTDYIDITDQYRIGYISKDDTEKLELSNFPTNESVFIRVDRDTGHSTVIARWIQNGIFFWYQDVPVFLDDASDLWKVEPYLP